MNKKILIVVILIVAAVSWRMFSGGEGGPGKKGKDDKPVTVVTAKVESLTLHDSVEVLGTAYANESIDITANATERLAEVRFTDGQSVKKGDIIAILEQDEEQAELQVAELQFKEHQREFVRLKGLFKNKAASQRDVDERQTLTDVAAQQVSGLKARIADRTLTAPFDGMLGIRRMSAGALVEPGQLITTLDDLHQIKLDFTVPSIYLAQLQEGMGIEARSEALGGQLFTGTVASIDTRVNAATRAVLVRAILPNPEHVIRPGVLMQVTLLKDARTTLVIPEEAVTQRQDKHFVMRVDSAAGTAKEQQITPGIRKPGILEVKEGLNEGDLVVVRGIEMVKNGGKVQIKDATADKTPPAEKKE